MKVKKNFADHRLFLISFVGSRMEEKSAKTVKINPRES